jgi:hypothetical protein
LSVSFARLFRAPFHSACNARALGRYSLLSRSPSHTFIISDVKSHQAVPAGMTAAHKFPKQQFRVSPAWTGTVDAIDEVSATSGTARATVVSSHHDSSCEINRYAALPTTIPEPVSQMKFQMSEVLNPEPRRHRSPAETPVHEAECIEPPHLSVFAAHTRRIQAPWRFAVKQYALPP